MSAALTIELPSAEVQEEWDDLCEAAGATPLHRPGWFSAWWSAFGEGEPELAALRRSGQLVAALPLQRTRHALSSPTNSHSPLFGPVARGRDDARELLERLYGLEARSVELSLLDVGDGTLELAAAAALRSGRRVFRRTVTRSPYVDVSGSWESFQAALSKNRLKGIRRRLRALESRGAVTVEVEHGDRELDRLLQEAFAVEASGWKGERGTAIVSRPETRRFYGEVAGWAARRGWLRLAFLRFDGRPIAVDFALGCDGSWYSLKSGYDHAFASSAPGVLLLYEQLRLAFQSGLRQFELLGGADQYKAEWTSLARERAWLQALSRSPAGLAKATMVQARERARPLARRVRRAVAR